MENQETKKEDIKKFLKSIHIEMEHFTNSLRNYEEANQKSPSKSVHGDIAKLHKHFTKQEIAYLITVKSREVEQLKGIINMLQDIISKMKPVAEKPKNVTEGGIILPS